MWARLCSKSFKLGFGSTWTENLQVYKLSSSASKRQRNQSSKYQHLLHHGKSNGIPEKHLLLLHWLYWSLCGSQLWKVLKEKGVPDHLACLLRNQYVGQETTVRTGHGKTDWFQTGKGIHQSCMLSPAYLTNIQSTLCEMLDWLNHKLKSRFPWEISIISDMQMIPLQWQIVQKN